MEDAVDSVDAADDEKRSTGSSPTRRAEVGALPALVTGATGFIGARLVRTLTQRGRPVRCLVRSLEAAAWLASPQVELVQGDLLDASSLERATQGVGEVYHLAAMLRAPWRKASHEVNALAVGRLAEACAGQPAPPALVVVSSLAAGGAGELRLEHQAPDPVSRYGRAKLAGERAALPWAERVPLTIVRPPIVLGPGDRAALPLFRMAARGLFLAPGSARLSVVNVDDLCEALVAAAARGARVRADEPGAGIYHASHPEALTLHDLGCAMAAAMGRPAPRPIPLPLAVVRLAGFLSEVYGRLRDRPTPLNRDKVAELSAGAWVCSSAKAERDLDFVHRPLALGLAESVAWYRAEGWL